MKRIVAHPILGSRVSQPISFTFDGRAIEAEAGETIASALMASGIRVFGHHPKDGAPQGIFCANGQCSQCLVVADGRPVKACMTPVVRGMVVESLDGLPELPRVTEAATSGDIERIDVDVLVIGGGPAGLSAALELGAAGVRVLLVDDKDRLGGKLVLQTHRFFGSINAVFAGTRGIDIGARLAAQVRDQPTITVALNSTALGVFSDGWVGVLRDDRYVLVRPRILLAATGAREKSLVFHGNTLPGVYGAGAFQTLVNRDRVKASERLFIVGGGNVGLIAGYHALQAGIDVVGLVEALPECGGYKVHRDKLARLGVPIYTSHTVLAAHGTDSVESVTIAHIDGDFRPVPDTERTFACDTVLIAVGLDPVDEFAEAATRHGFRVYAAGDAEEIAEASAAIFSGRIAGRRIALELGAAADPVPEDWERTAELLKSRPGKTHAHGTAGGAAPSSQAPEGDGARRVGPVFHCSQEIPCNPCSSVCPQGLIHIDDADIRHVPRYIADRIGKACIGCTKCITICPGLAITLVDAREDPSHPLVTVPYEIGRDALRIGANVMGVDVSGTPLGEFPVREVLDIAGNDRTVLVKLAVPQEMAARIAGIRPRTPWIDEPMPDAANRVHDDDIVCRCERVTAREIRDAIQAGCRDMNELKTLTRAGMGACGGKTCQALILRLFRECGVDPDEVTKATVRPLFVEVPFGTFAGVPSQRDGRTPTQTGEKDGR